MAQFSRPYQIALAVLVVAAAAWFLALRPHSSSETTAPSKPPTAPGVAGLTKDIAKAHAAAATSEQNAHQLQQRSDEASTVTGGTPASTAHASTAAASPAPSAAKTHAATPSAPAKSATSTRGSIHAYAGAGRVPSRQVLVERALAEGKPAVILFWDKSGSDDRATRAELQLLEFEHHLIRKLHSNSALKKLLVANHMYLGPFAAFFASAKQVTEFGTVTRGIQVYSTPTLIVIGTNHQARVLTGLTDAFAIQQAIEEARSA